MHLCEKVTLVESRHLLISIRFAMTGDKSGTVGGQFDRGRGRDGRVGL